MRIDWKAGVGLGVSALLVWWVFHGADLGAIARQLASADLAMLSLTGVILTSGGLIGALRWHVLLEPLAVSTTLDARWAALNIGFMVTNLFPVRLGEIVRPFALSRMAPVSMSGAFGTVVLERTLDVVALLILLVVSLLSPAFPADATIAGRSIGSAVSGAVLVAAAALTVVGAMILWPKRVTRLAEPLRKALPSRLGERLAAGLAAFLSGLESVRRPAVLLKALSWSLLPWVWWAARVTSSP